MPRVSKPSASAPVAEQTARRRPRSVDSGRGDGPSARSVGQKRPRSSLQCEGRCTHERDAQRRDVARRMRTNEDRQQAVNIQYEYAFVVL